MIKYVIQYDDSVSVTEYRDLVNYLTVQFPEEKFIFIPQKYLFKTFSIEQMIEVRNQMNKIIEESQKEINNE